ncbi:hypothetical protein [Pigmentibacter ruber]|uniref:hypothetical protein n=1 Tax=Pigmentibacter ruber TaxID=2683196 RepID=UPI00131C08CB|nr:hypothetical protein [Pigmentibacter ruber]
MHEVNVKIPAKAMLFGEYGVLNHGKAIAVTFDQYFFKFNIKVSSNFKDSSLIKIKSDFFSSKEIEFSSKELELKTPLDKKTLFFIKLLQPWYCYIKNRNIEISILNSYSPSLGFGSSSAIISGIAVAFNSIFLDNKPIFSNPIFWKNIRQSIINVQGKGSGYDVAVQLAHYLSQSENEPIQFWVFQNQEDSEIPNITKFKPKDDINLYGCFLKTNIYSDTKKAIYIFSQDNKKEEFANSHTKLAESFINDSSIKNLNYLMKSAQVIASKQNILPVEETTFNNLIIQLNSYKVTFKTMGAGHGDCLWTLATPDYLINNCKILKDDIVFAFSKVGDLNER